MRKRIGIIIFSVIYLASIVGAGASSISLDRIMTSHVIPGSTVDVNLFLEINVSESPSGFIIKEYFPVNWEIIGSSHTCYKDNSEKSLMWVFFRGDGNEPYCAFSNCYAGNLTDIELIYRIKINNDSLGNYNFTNVILTQGGLNDITSANIIVSNDGDSNTSTPPSSPGSSGGSSGGVSGGGSSNSNSVYISKLVLGGNVVEIPSGIDDYLYQLELFSKEVIYSLSLAISYSSNSPYGKGDPPGETIKFLRVNPSNPNLDRDLESVFIYFKIEKEFFSNDSVDRNSIKMYRFVEPEWQLLDTVHLVEDDEFVYFKSISPGFSDFAIVSVDEFGPQVYTEEKASVTFEFSTIEKDFIDLIDFSTVNLKEVEKDLFKKIMEVDKKYTFEEPILKMDNRETKGFPVIVIIFFSLLFLLIRSVIKN